MPEQIDEKAIEYTDRSGKDYRLTVGYANILMDTRRGVYQIHAEAQNLGETDEAIIVLRRHVYPDCVAATVKQEGFDHWPPTFEAFCQLEPRMVSQWSEAAYETNPNWRLNPPEGEEREKKV